MTAGKRQLKDRIARIAENRQTRSAALFAVLALAAGVCAVTFTGAGNAGASQPLTGEELAWFNEDFFNQGDSPCMPNQFLTCLYDSPEEIDLFQLFYNGTGEPEAWMRRNARRPRRPSAATLIRTSSSFPPPAPTRCWRPTPA